MDKILAKFDEAKELANSAVNKLKYQQELLVKKEAFLKSKEAELKDREIAVKKGEKKVKAAEKLLKTQAELDLLVDEAKQRLLAIENQEKNQRAAYVKKQNELDKREGELSAKEKELEAGFARLREKEKNFKKRIVDDMTKKIF